MAKRKIIDPEILQAQRAKNPKPKKEEYYNPNKGITPNLDFLNEPPLQHPTQVVDLPKKEDI